MNSIHAIGDAGLCEIGKDQPNCPTEADNLTIFVVDTRPVIRECLVKALSAEIHQAKITALTMDKLDISSVDAALIVLSFSSCNESNVNEILISTLCSFPTTPIAVVADDTAMIDIAVAARYGLRGCFSTSTELKVLVQGIHFILAGGTALPRITHTEAQATSQEVRSRDTRLNQICELNPSINLFTPKEIEVMRCLAKGQPNKIIAYEMGLCETTVKVHIRHIFTKLRATNRTQVALLCRDLLAE